MKSTKKLFAYLVPISLGSYNHSTSTSTTVYGNEVRYLSDIDVLVLKGHYGEWTRAPHLDIELDETKESSWKL